MWVIPKEIRRTMRIREGDPLEIYTDKDGEVIFKKYSLMGALDDFAGQICETLSKNTGCIVAVSDRDSIIAASGTQKRELVEKRLSSELMQIMEGRQIYQNKQADQPMPVIDSGDKYKVAIAAPIITEGDVLGCVLFLAVETDARLGETEYKLAQTIAGFLGKHMET